MTTQEVMAALVEDARLARQLRDSCATAHARERGMRQKISLAGALIHAPSVILLDEPTVGLDPKGARTMKDILRELCRRGTTVFISTHILEIAERMCDRIAIVNRGRVIAEGTMEQLRSGAGVRPHAQAGVGATPVANGNGAAPDSVDTPVDNKSLEDIFLELTGGSEAADLAQYLG